MIPVSPAPEPAAFDAAVRQPGLAALRRLAEKHGGSRDAIPASEFPPLWRHSLDDLLTRYGRICSYLCLYIPAGVGAPSTDHMLAKSTAWQQVYEWGNYRLACSLMNSRKGAAATVLDPFEVEPGWFVLDTTLFRVAAGRGLASDIEQRVVATIRRLRLNDQQCCDARGEFAHSYWAGEISVDYLARHAPFVARELRRLGELLPGHS